MSPGSRASARSSVTRVASPLSSTASHTAAGWPDSRPEIAWAPASTKANSMPRGEVRQTTEAEAGSASDRPSIGRPSRLIASRQASARSARGWLSVLNDQAFIAALLTFHSGEDVAGDAHVAALLAVDHLGDPEVGGHAHQGIGVVLRQADVVAEQGQHVQRR